MGKKKMLMRKFGSVAVVNNTFIGGVASVINTPALLAAKLVHYPSGAAFSENDIQKFTIVGNDIECYIGVDYQLLHQAFVNTNETINSPTFFIDTGNCKKLDYAALYRSFNTVLVDLPGVIICGLSMFYDAGYTRTSQLVIHLDACTYIGDPNVADELMFGYQTDNSKLLYINKFLETNNNGGVDATILYAQANQNLTVIFV